MPRSRANQYGGGIGDLLLAYFANKVETNPEFNLEAPLGDTNQPYKAKNWLSKLSAGEANRDFAGRRLLSQGGVLDALNQREKGIPLLEREEGVKTVAEQARGANLTGEQAKRGFNEKITSFGFNPNDPAQLSRFQAEITPELFEELKARTMADKRVSDLTRTQARQADNIALATEDSNLLTAINKKLIDAEGSELDRKNLPALHKAKTQSALMAPDVIGANVLADKYGIGMPGAQVFDKSTGTFVPNEQVPFAPTGLDKARQTLGMPSGNTPGSFTGQPQARSGGRAFVRLPDGTLEDPVTKKKYREVQ